MMRIKNKINNIKMKMVKNGRIMVMGNNKKMMIYGMILVRRNRRVNKTMIMGNKTRIKMNFRTMTNQESLDRVFFYKY
jgi:hypothetical protein